MTGIEGALIALVLIVGFYTAWNIGANDVANAMGTSVGSGALTLRQAVIVAGIFEFLGAFLVGANVSETVRKKMFDPGLLPVIHGDQAAVILALGMIAALLATGTWLMFASYFHWPVSTTHSIVGAVVGFGCVGVGFGNVDWAQVGLITVGWVVSPLLSGTIAYLLFRTILRRVFFKNNPVAAAKQLAPYLVFLVLIVLIGVATFKGLNPLWARLSIDPFDPRITLLIVAVAGLAGFGGMAATRRLVRDVPEDGVGTGNPVRSAELSRSLDKAAAHLQRVQEVADGPMNDQVAILLKNIGELQSSAEARSIYGTDSTQLQHVEKIFVFLQILTASFVAFAHGSNDVANAIGPMSAAYQAVVTGEVALQAAVPGWALALGGAGIVVGLATWGWRVIETVGRRITELTPSRGFCAEFAAAITILLASILPLGLPVSTTHTLVGAVLGVGLARGIGSLNMRVMRDIVASWAITIPVGAGLSIAFYFGLKFMLLDSGLGGG
jgi:phosphate/sulfate permease